MIRVALLTVALTACGTPYALHTAKPPTASDYAAQRCHTFATESVAGVVAGAVLGSFAAAAAPVSNNLAPSDVTGRQDVMIVGVVAGALGASAVSLAAGAGASFSRECAVSSGAP